MLKKANQARDQGSDLTLTSELPSMRDEGALIDSATEISPRRTVLNAGASYGRYAVVMVLGLVLQGYVIRKLGRNEYALWPLILTCMNFASLIPIGIGSGTSRFLAHALGRKDFQEIERITTSLFAALLVGALLYAVAVILTSFYFERIFDIPEGTAQIGPRAMLLAGIGGAVALPFSVFQGGLTAAQEFVYLNALGVVSVTARLLLTVLAFTVSAPSLIWIAVIQSIVTIGENVATFLLVRRVVPWQRIRWRAFSWSTLRETHTYSLLVLVTTIAGLLYWRTDNIIINKLLEPSLLTGYAVVAGFVIHANQLTTLGISSIAPVATIMHARQEIPRLCRLLYRGNCIVVPIVSSALLFLMVFRREVLSLYVGPEYAEYGVLFLIHGAGFIISTTQSISGLVPRAFGRIGVVAVMSLLVAILNVVLSVVFVLVFHWGLVGVALGTAVVTVVYRLIFWPWYIARMLGVPASEYLLRTVILPLTSTLPFLTVLLASYYSGLGQGWTGLAVTFLLAGLAEIAYMVGYGLERPDRVKAREVINASFGSLRLLCRANRP